jgi:protein SCO1/2
MKPKYFPVAMVLLLATPVVLHFALKGLKRERPDDLGTLPDFAFTDEQGRRFTSADLDGKLWVADFFFTRCSGVCPMLAERMRDVGRFVNRHPRFAQRIGLLSITVDPSSDTPERLAEYGKREAVDPARWRLLTGPSGAVEDVVVRGFHVAMGKPETDPASGRLDVLHGSHLVLLDARHGRARILGYYDGDPSGVGRLTADLGHLLDAEDLK